MPRTPDLLVIGGGVFGLSLARAALREDLSVTLAEADRIGAGASGGPVGALAPFAPRGWSARAAFQLAGLLSIGAEADLLAEETGLDPGYRRTGRLMPLATDQDLARARQDAAAAGNRWPDWARIEVLDQVPNPWRRWLTPEAAPAGVLHDNFSARITPSAWLAALKASCLPRLTLLEGWRLTTLGPDGAARFDKGALSAGHVAVAIGWRSFAALGLEDAGWGEKGQAALLAADPGDVPLLAGNGLYAVPQPGGVAVGSTRERGCTRTVTDHRLDALIEEARTASPLLRDAPVLRRWSAMRPRADGRLPMVGPLPGRPRLLAATGGAGIGFAMAHLVADALVAHITGRTPRVALPPGSAPAAPLPLKPAAR